MTDITLTCLSLFLALITMMVAAEMGRRRRSGHPPADGHTENNGPNLWGFGGWGLRLGPCSVWGDESGSDCIVETA
jgi:hypothetical protein